MCVKTKSYQVLFLGAFSLFLVTGLFIGPGTRRLCWVESQGSTLFCSVRIPSVYFFLPHWDFHRSRWHQSLFFMLARHVHYQAYHLPSLVCLFKFYLLTNSDWSVAQSFAQQAQGPGFDPQHYKTKERSREGKKTKRKTELTDVATVRTSGGISSVLLFKMA